jgi:polysaccharide deacetylase family protein (PEP-CTERM system associated)
MEKNVDDTCDLLERFQIKATFFTLGWIGEKRPEVIQKLVAKGHEIASAGHEICSVREMGPERFRQDLRRARHTLEGAGSNRIVGYRCAYGWIRDSELWALNILAEEGYYYDASYRPPFLTLGSNGLCRFAREIQTPAAKIWEFPVSTFHHLGMSIPISGGNYLRQLPKKLMLRAFRLWCEETKAPFVLYFHPWELDPEQPRINLVSQISKLRQYRNLGLISKLLPFYFETGQFQSISQYLDIPLRHPDDRLPKISKDDLPYPVRKDLGEGIKEVTIIIPVFNETSSLFYLRRTLDELVKETEKQYKIKFIFVDDASMDQTFEELLKFFRGREEFRVFRHTQNQGIAGALSTGFKAAETEIICSMDADCSYDPLELMKMIPLLEEGVDLVTASPYHRDGAVRNVPRWRLFLSKSLSRLYHVLLRHKLATYTSCLRVYRKSSVMDLDIQNTGFLGIAELIAKLDIHGGTIREHPATLESRIFGQSKMQVLKTILGHLKLLMIIMNHRRKVIIKNSLKH